MLLSDFSLSADALNCMWVLIKQLIHNLDLQGKFQVRKKGV